MSKKRKPSRPTTASVPAPPPAAERSEARASPRRAWVLAAVAAGVLLAAVAWQLTRAPTPAPSSAVATRVVASFAGSPACKSCHPQQFAAWTSSQHARAMQHATAETVRGDFSDATFTYQGVTSNFFRRDGKYFVRTDGPDGKLADFEVKYTFGVEPLQQYLVELPGGRLQALALSWDTRPKEAGGQRWFRQYPDEKIDFRDELHWTRRGQNWNFMCADCHSSQVAKGYDATKDAFATHWNEISVGCESCHGPGSAHVAWADSKSADPGKGLTVAAGRAARRQLEHRPGNRQRDAQPRAHERARDRGLCAVPCAARADRRGLSSR